MENGNRGSWFVVYKWRWKWMLRVGRPAAARWGEVVWCVLWYEFSPVRRQLGKQQIHLIGKTKSEGNIGEGSWDRDQTGWLPNVFFFLLFFLFCWEKMSMTVGRFWILWTVLRHSYTLVYSGVQSKQARAQSCFITFYKDTVKNKNQ